MGAGDLLAAARHRAPVVLGDPHFDADGDGHEDVALIQCCQTAIVRYGPFSGRVPSAFLGDADPASYSMLGDYSGCSISAASSMLPSHGAVALGQDALGECSVDTEIYALQVPRGARVPPSEHLGWAASFGEGLAFDDAGDLDGDGSPDAIYGDQFESLILGGPLAGFVPDMQPIVVQPEPGHNAVVRAVGDVNGDGVQELLGVWVRWHDPDVDPPWDRSWMLYFSPHPDVLDPAAGLEIGIVEQLGDDLGRRHGDLDGDGLSDLIGRGGFGLMTENAGQVEIWYGRDLLAAWDEQRARRQ